MKPLWSECVGCTCADGVFLVAGADGVSVRVLRLMDGSMSLIRGAESDFAEYAALLSVVLHDLFVCNNK